MWSHSKRERKHIKKNMGCERYFHFSFPFRMTLGFVVVVLAKTQSRQFSIIKLTHLFIFILMFIPVAMRCMKERKSRTARMRWWCASSHSSVRQIFCHRRCTCLIFVFICSKVKISNFRPFMEKTLNL